MERAEKVEFPVRPYLCPECEYNTQNPDEMGRHIERHRPMTGPQFGKHRCKECRGAGCDDCHGTGRRRITRECPNGCKRHFRRPPGPKKFKGTLEMNAHIRNCDGSPPFPPTGTNGR